MAKNFIVYLDTGRNQQRDAANLEITDRLPKEYFPKVEEAHPGALASSRRRLLRLLRSAVRRAPVRLDSDALRRRNLFGRM